MAIYALIQSNVVTNIIVWDGAVPLNLPNGVTTALLSSLPTGAGIGWVDNAGAWSAPAVIPPTSQLNFEQFASLFTAAEWAAILTAAGTNPTILAWLLKAASFSGTIALNSAYITTALTYLVNQSLLTAPRAATVASGVVMNPNA